MPEYDFSTLSPVDFEALVAELLQAELNVHVESFGPGRDKGIDLRCAVANKSIVIQCKHYLRGGRTALRRSIEKEATKWRDSRNVGRYILATSVSMTVELKEFLVSALSPVLPVKEADILGQEDINALLSRHPQVELRQFKLWTSSAAVLSRIVHSGLWNRTEELLESIEKRAKFYVGTEHFNRVMQVLEEDQTCVITGSPGVGKSILAEMTLLAHWKEQWQVVQISEDVKEGFEMWDPIRPQIFYYDDFLGQTDIAETTGKNEDHRIAQFVEKIRRADVKNKRFVLTTREQIFRHARERSDRIRRAESSLVPTEVKVEDYSTYTKAHIFYNHLFFSDLPERSKRQLVNEKKYLGVIRHENYSPRLLEQVIRYKSQSLTVLLAALEKTLDDPAELWSSSYHHLSSTGRKILSVLATYPPRGIPEKKLRTYARGHEPFAYIQALKVLEGTWIKISDASLARGQRQAARMVSLANPSCRDFLVHQLDSSPTATDAALEDAQDMEQMLMLLRYSGLDRVSSLDEGVFHEARGRLDYQRYLRPHLREKSEISKGDPKEGIREALIDNSGTLVRKIRSSFKARVEEWVTEMTKKSDGYRVIIPDPRPEMLTTVLPFIVGYGSAEDVAWCQSMVEELIEEDDTGLPEGTTDAYLSLALAVYEYPFGGSRPFEGFVRLAISEIYDPADMDLFFDVLQPEHFSEELQEAVRSGVRRFAESEYEHWRFESDYQESRNAVDFVEKIADIVDLPVDEMLTRWRESVDQDEAESEDERRFAESPTTRSAEEDQAGASSADMIRVVELFSTLAEE
ncbi:nSTAND3 domain-containing NTPase [Streptomyces sp. NPDC002596]